MTSYVANASAYPYSTVVKIEARFADGTGVVGTGVVVGRNEVLTASHVVYDGRSGPATSVTVTPALNGSAAPFGRFASSNTLYYSVDSDGDGLLSTGESQVDVALLGFATALGDDTGWMGLNPNFTGGMVSVTGYPVVYGGNRMTTDSGSAFVDQQRGLVNTSRLEINSGNSGGPVWQSINGVPYVIGIVSTAVSAFWMGHEIYSTLLGGMQDNDSLLSDPGAPVDDFAAGTSTTGLVNVNGFAVGTIGTAADRDWFAVDLTAGTRYELSVIGQGLADPHLRLRNGNGTEIAADDDGGPGLNPQVAFTPGTTGRYYLDVSSADGGIGAYRVRAAIAPPDGVTPRIRRMVDGVTEEIEPTAYDGPVAYLRWQWIGGDTNEVVAGTSEADFLNLLAGDDAIDAGAGDDVIDGGLNSNFMTGGAGFDTFFADGRTADGAAGRSTWSTITDWVPAEHMSLWGWQPGTSRMEWVGHRQAPTATRGSPSMPTWTGMPWSIPRSPGPAGTRPSFPPRSR